ncbi:MAG: extracellular solute-binding protein [Chloroflexi bacterium]|nr:extracellular solute-binding protein [Chloroflexota bacterium]
MSKSWKSTLLLFAILPGLAACRPQIPPVEGTPSLKTETAASSSLKTPQETKVPEVTGDAGQLAGLQIHFLHPWAGETSRVMAQLVDEFNQTNEWGIHVIIQAPGSAGMATTEYQNGILNGNPVDLVAASLSLLLSSDQKEKNILDLNPYVLSSKYGLSQEEQNDFLSVFWNGDVVAGKRLGLPAQRTAGFLFYNSTWASELGYSAGPATSSDFRKQVCAANASLRADADLTNDALGGWIEDPSAITITSWLRSFGALQPGEEILSFESEESIAAYQYLYQLQKEACAWPSRLPEPYDYFSNRQTLAYSGVMQDVMKQTEAFARSGSKDSWTVLPYPSESRPGAVTNGYSYGILKSDPENQLAAWLFVRWLSTPEHQARILQTAGTLPLGEKVQDLLAAFKAAYPQWQQAVDQIPGTTWALSQSNGEIIHTVLEDSAWQLFNAGFQSDQIPGLLRQVDETIQELSERDPW